ncbi:MAG: hypothetical protein ACPG06_01200 [Alphaproteobacteria bacterium]
MTLSAQLSALLHNRAIGKQALTQMNLSDLPVAPIGQEEEGFFIEYPDMAGHMVRRAVALDDACVDEHGDIRLSVRLTLNGERAPCASSDVSDHVTALAYIAAIDGPVDDVEHALIVEHVAAMECTDSAPDAAALAFQVKQVAEDVAAFDRAMKALAAAEEPELLSFLRTAARVIHANGEVTCAERKATQRINALLAATGHIAHLDLGHGVCLEPA